MSPVLKSAHIKNFKSLGDVNLNFKNLTIIVGANSSGKSSCLESLALLREIVKHGKTFPSRNIKNDIRENKNSEGIFFQVLIQDKQVVDYSIRLILDRDAEKNLVVLSENLKIGETQVISVVNGEGEVRDEDEQGGKQVYHSTPDTIALSSTGSFGIKPITLSISEFVKHWEFYDLDPESIRSYGKFMASRSPTFSENPNILDIYGYQLKGLLQKLASDENNQTFMEIANEVKKFLNVHLVIRETKKDIKEIKAIEPNGSEIPFSNLSDGTLRMIGYISLLYSSHLPTLIAIEEPEINLHPAILVDLASVLKRLSQKTQVVITTHSPQLLDCFGLQDIANDVSIILVRKHPESGTEAVGLDKLSQDCDGLRDWMQDFGIGSAIYHSNLIQKVLAN